MPKLHRPAPLTAAVLVLGVGLVVGFLAIRVWGPSGTASVGAAAGSAAASADPGFTLTATSWDLDDVLRHAAAGDLSAIGALSAAKTALGTGAAPVLVARTVDGALEPVRLQIPVGDALDAIRAAGFGSLLTDEAIALAAPVDDPARGLVGILISAALVGVVVLVMRRRSMPGRSSWRPGALIDRRRARTESPERPSVTMADVAGADEAKVELNETIEFLKDPARFARVGAKAVRGVMLYGPPGTGKTLLAKAVATEAGVPFHSVSGSEFVEKFVGVGAGRVRDLFASARAAGRGVIFIDEIDALAKTRGGANSHDEREQTLNQLLVEMDGFATGDEIVVIGATNRLDTLDPAVLRPGRFTRKIHVPLPDRDGRLAVLRVHAANKPIARDVDLPAVARKTYGFSGAMLADLLNEAAILTARSRRESIGPEEVHAGWLKTAIGTSRKRSMDDRERSIIAVHEAGHAVCGFLHGDKRRVEEISLFAHGEALGVTVSSSEDNDLPSERDLRARLVALMGGRVAEELLFSEVTGGASSDFEQATSIASAMVLRFGMGQDPESTDAGATGRGVLSILVGSSSEGMDGPVRDAQARAIRALLDDAYATARRTLLAEMGRLRRVAAYLYEQERIDGDAFDALMAGRLAPIDADDWRAAAAAPRPWETIPDLFTERRAATAPVPLLAGDGVRSRTSPVVVQPSSSPIPSAAPAGRRLRGRLFRRPRPAGHALPALSGRLRRSIAAMVRELAADDV
ncbi:MAG: ATP-dependent metallopeptidase FtsH/Yme1/Tma family protein [Candidatus Limnocylindrales bacterium]